MATLTAQQITVSGITPSLATSAAGGDQFANDGTQVVWIQNNHASAARTFTFVTQATLGGLAVTDLTVTTKDKYGEVLKRRDSEDRRDDRKGAERLRL